MSGKNQAAALTAAKTQALVTEIERGSFEDGPGMRTVVFFKGCPLHCAWCHNPECIDPQPQEMYYPEKCIGCGQCAQGCFSGARVVCGKPMTAGRIMAQIELDAPYYGKNGGVTFSGGEPLLQGNMLRELMPLCHEKNIHTAVETSLYLYDEQLLASCDLVMADLKIWDEALHKKWTGVSNAPILQHFRQLDALNVPILVRTPIIPGINDTPGQIDSIRDFLRTLHHVTQYELLPYHALGVPKQQALGQETVQFSVPEPEKMEELRHHADLS